jgi:hypothetical protein
MGRRQGSGFWVSPFRISDFGLKVIIILELRPGEISFVFHRVKLEEFRNLGIKYKE